MKIFWTFIGVLAALTVGLFVFEDSGAEQAGQIETVSSPAPTGAVSEPSRAAQPPAADVTKPEQTEPVTAAEPVRTMTPDAVESPTEASVQDVIAERASDIVMEPQRDTFEPTDQTAMEDDGPTPPAAITTAPPPVSETSEVSFDDLLAMLPSSTPEQSSDTSADAEPAEQEPAKKHNHAKPFEPATPPEEPPVEFALEGKGTKESPYIIDWDMLTAARATYDPRNGKNEIPQAVNDLDGKWVRLSGYSLFPLTNPQPRELLMMLNAWDGCCIGVPPSPYDAIEITLSAPVSEERFAQQGAVTGVLKVDPYLVGDWLIGLYTMSSASFEVEG